MKPFGVTPTAQIGTPCPITGMWYCEGISPEQGTCIRKGGDPMPGQGYRAEQRATMVWHLLILVSSLDGFL